MEAENISKPEKKPEDTPEKKQSWVDKTEAFIDEAAEKIHKSETYRKADQSLEEATKKLFRKAGRWWGKL
ncbi:hypothetical protein [Maribellus sp. YY47]|uniref:hypothetical protein n=1 Tax=Maribellus sp. YY47 TaxID=2929486 RepID=UPI0020007DD2|nr:hypothetical protein [Maribellus sp. YY47]MCK3685311.1 hypothetical protein [Maribellus sp. YY47]